MKNLSISEIEPGTGLNDLRNEFKSTNDFHQWLYQNFDEITEQYRPNHIRWGNLYLEIPIIGTREFSQTLEKYLKEVEASSKPIEQLTTLSAKIERDLSRNKLKAPSINLHFKRRHPNNENFDVSLLELENRLFVVANDSIYKNEIPKIKSTISYLEAMKPINPNEIESTPTIFEGIQWKGSATDLAELIKGLAGMEVVFKDSKPITEKDLKLIFERVFNTQVSSVPGLIRPRYEKESSVNKETFLSKADAKLKQYIQRIRDKER